MFDIKLQAALQVNWREEYHVSRVGKYMNYNIFIKEVKLLKC